MATLFDNTAPVLPLRPAQVTAVAATDLRELAPLVPFLAALPAAGLDELAGAAVRLEYASDDIICRQGEYETRLYFVLQGQVELTARTRLDPNIALLQLGAGAFFGTYPNWIDVPHPYSATATAPTVLFAIAMDDLRPVLGDAPQAAELLAEVQRERTIYYALRLAPVFAGLDRATLGRLADSARLRRYGPDHEIFAQGDSADSVHLVLNGTVKIVRRDDDGPAGDHVLSYLMRGAAFGEMGLVHHRPRAASAVAKGLVDTLQIGRGVFEAALDGDEALADAVRRDVLEREAHNRDLESHPELALRLQRMEGLVSSREILVLDMKRCIRCDNCVRACEAVRGAPRLKTSGERFGHWMIVTACRQCRDPSCMLCPRGAITRDRHGDIHFDDRCVGCGSCAKRCPYGNITLVDAKPVAGGPRRRKKAVRCDLCRGMPYAPCVHNCPTGTLRRVPPGTFLAEDLEQ